MLPVALTSRMSFPRSLLPWATALVAVLGCDDHDSSGKADPADGGGSRLVLLEAEGREDPPLISQECLADPSDLDASAPTTPNSQTDVPGPSSTEGSPEPSPGDAPSTPEDNNWGAPAADPDSPWTDIAEGLDAGPRPEGTVPFSCTFRSTSTFSQLIPTVAIVEFTVTLEDVDSAFVEYGPTTDYGLRAPVDPAQPGFRTVLLGMAPLTQQHYRVTMESAGQSCTSQDFLFTSGPVPDEFPRPHVETSDSSAVAKGFTISEQLAGEQAGQIFVLDQDGEIVWFYRSQLSTVSRARISPDGQFMYGLSLNESGTDGAVVRIAMDGSSEEVLDAPAAHDDFALTPDGSLVLIESGSNGCDELSLFSAGESERIFRVRDAYPSGVAVGNDDAHCDVNTVLYHAEDDSITFSDLANNAIVKVSRSGELLWVLGGTFSDYDGAGAEWERQHGHQLLDDGHVLLFSNGPAGQRSPATAIEVQLNDNQSTARVAWSYESWRSSDAFGDVQRLPNGNTLVTVSDEAALQQVDSDGNVVQELSFSFGARLGYSEFHETLYGSPR
jgi:hypothetical protein